MDPERWAWSWSKLFETNGIPEVIFPKKKKDFEKKKKNSRQQKAWKITQWAKSESTPIGLGSAVAQW